ncbi:MAG: T9SS type A sorting domain-containing protein, partial [Bacteroidia bacterium]|nr:T9SS type A sorting domain-containing protein [Bacteroidia bacterium]
TIPGKNGFVSASNAWVTGLTAANYNNHDYTILYSPAFDFSGAGTYTLQFYTKFHTEPQYDGYIVEYSTNKGLSWTQLNNTVATGWYNTTAATSQIFPAGTAFFSGTQSTYSFVSQDVSFLAGTPYVCFRFVFKTDRVVVGSGAAIDDFEILYNPTLPNTALNLQGIHKNGQNLLTWKVENPQNVQFYTVEYSPDGSHFYALPDKIQSTQSKEYTYSHYSPYSRTFYRVVQHNKDGQNRFSNIVEISIAENTSLIVYPIPAQSSLSVQANFNAIGKVQYTLLNTNGQIVLTQNEDVQWAGAYTHSISIQSLPAGIYYLRIQESHQTTVKKIVKM